VVLIIGVALVAALVVRHSTSVEAARRLTLIAVVALGVRLAAVTAVYFIAIRTHAEGTFLNDEASFYLAAESLLPNPFNKSLQQGLGHLGSDGYLGVLTAISVALGSGFGHMDTVAFRLVNATFGALLVLTVSLVAARLFGPRPALVAGLVLAVWPTLVLWSAMFLRDTLVGLTLAIVWWTLRSHRRLTDVRVICVSLLALLLMASLRSYVADALAVGIVGWGVWPTVAQRSRRFLVASAAVGALLCVGLAVNQWRHIDEYAHQLVYRQLTTRMEAIGQLYRDPNPDEPPPEPPFGPGTAVALVDPNSNWITPGIIEHALGPGRVLVGFTDGTQSEHQISELTLLQSAPLSPVQLASSVGPGIVAFITGTSVGGDDSSPGWTADALAWDALFVLAVLGGLRFRLPLREWILPASVVLGTAAALSVVPGAPGNDDRHRSAQALPFLVVFATAWLVERGSRGAGDGESVSSATSSPITAGTADNSRVRSLR
jgi:hypothetical protein